MYDDAFIRHALFFFHETVPYWVIRHACFFTRHALLGLRHAFFLKTNALFAFNPFRTAVSIWGQTTQTSSSLSPKRDCGSKGVKACLGFYLVYYVPYGVMRHALLFDKTMPYWVLTLLDPQYRFGDELLERLDFFFQDNALLGDEACLVG